MVYTVCYRSTTGGKNTFTAWKVNCEYKFVGTSNPHTSPHKAIVAVQTASDQPTFHYKCIVLCKTALAWQ